MATLLGHNDEVLDVCFNYTGQLIATASADGETSQSNPQSQPSHILQTLSLYFLYGKNILGLWGTICSEFFMCLYTVFKKATATCD